MSQYRGSAPTAAGRRKRAGSRPPAPPSSTPAPWVVPAGRLAETLETNLDAGLNAAEAAGRLAVYGRNELHSDAGPSALALFLGQFKSLVIWVLVAAAALSAALGEGADALAIGAIVLLNACIGFYQEFRAERAVSALRKMAAPLARVQRDGHARMVPAAEVVPGDVLLLEAGDLVAADARLVSAAALRVNEAPLTGESEAVEKDPSAPTGAETPLADRTNMVYLGTSVVAGQGRALVAATGMETEVGHIARLLESAGDGQTPLQQRLDRVGRLLLVASLGIVAVVFFLGLLRGERPGPMLLTAVSLAIAAVPEGLPAVVTIALALGVGRMVRRNALVRRLPAVETLGCAQVICSDKTGTLTTGQMTVRSLWAAGREIALDAETHNGDPQRRDGARRLAGDPAAHAALQIAAACNEAELREETGQERIFGDPGEGALLVAAARAGIHRDDVEKEYPRVRVLPFDSERKRMTVVRRTPTGPQAFVKGAPDVLLARCTRWLGPDGRAITLTDTDRLLIAGANETLAGRALRVMAVAFRPLAESACAELDAKSLEQDLTFAGLLALQDPPRPEARRAVQQAQSAGIRTVMITGDHPATAAAIARELGIFRDGDEVATGFQVQQMSDAELRERVERISVYARVTAEDKLRVVRAFKSEGLVVAMTGDGVNDAPAIREAAIGIAMGLTGTEVTKEASDMVVTDDNFASIVAAVEEGRGIYDNIKKCLQYLLAGNTGEILIMLVAVLVGWPMPLLPLQLLWINLVTDGFPALALATDPVDPDVLSRPPRRPDEQLADRAFLITMFFTGALTAAVGLGAFYYGLAVEGSLAAAQNYAFTTVVFAELFRSFGVRHPDVSLWRRRGPGNVRLTVVVVASIILQLFIHHVPALERLFGIEPVSPSACIGLLALGTVPMITLELRKELATYRRRQPRSPGPVAAG